MKKEINMTGWHSQLQKSGIKYKKHLYAHLGMHLLSIIGWIS